MIEQLEQFMEGRPHDKDKNIVDATMEYIEQVEEASKERYWELRKIHDRTQRIVGKDF